MRYFLSIILFSVCFSSYSQGVFTEQKDTLLKSKMDQYKAMLKKADIYEAKTETELQKITTLKAEARRNLDSAYMAAKRAEIDRSKAPLYILQFNFFYDQSSMNTKKADSVLATAQSFKDTANILNKEAESFYIKLAQDYKPVFEKDTLLHIIYIVQLGAGNMNRDYFEKATGVEVITPSDGIKRYVIGKFYSKEVALEYRQKMIDLGYIDAFIRTIDSLNY